MGASLEDTENRIVLITDAEPNTGDFTTEGLAARLKANAADGIFTTIVGVGLDFNTELIDAISRVKVVVTDPVERAAVVTQLEAEYKTLTAEPESTPTH